MSTPKFFSTDQTDAFRKRLLRSRRALARELGVADEALKTIDETREIELEERSQEEAAADVISRLGERAFEGLREIDGALRRIERGTYGICIRCAASIAIERLRATPSVPLCSQCAEARDRTQARAACGTAAEEVPEKAAIPPDLAALGDVEIAELVRQHFRDEVGEALSGVRVICRHGLVTLGGAVANDELRQIARRIVEDEIGLQLSDRIEVGAVAAEKPTDEVAETVPAGGQRAPNIFDVEEHGLDYTPPARPVAEVD